MKSLKDYLTESKKAYSFKIKVAGELPENFHENLKKSLVKHNIITFEKMTTPIQEAPLDFPELANKEVTIFDLAVEYPITGPEISNHIKDMGMSEECFRVRGSAEPSEYDQLLTPDGESTLLDDPYYKESENAKHRDYFGDEFNKDFLKELAKAAQERKKELGQDKGDQDVLSSSPKIETNKEGVKSAMGS